MRKLKLCVFMLVMILASASSECLAFWFLPSSSSSRPPKIENWQIGDSMTPERLVSTYLDNFGSFLDKIAGRKEYDIFFMAASIKDKKSFSFNMKVKGSRLIRCEEIDRKNQFAHMSWRDIAEYLNSNGCSTMYISSSPLQSVVSVLAGKKFTQLPPFEAETFEGKISKVTLPSPYLGFKKTDSNEFTKFLIDKYSISYDDDLSQVSGTHIFLRDEDSKWMVVVGKGLIVPLYFKQELIFRMALSNPVSFPYDYPCVTLLDTTDLQSLQ